MPIRRWPTLGCQETLRTPIFSLETRQARSPRTGEVGEFYVLRYPDWVNVIPIDRDDNVVFVRQYRHGADCETLEIPGGVVDPEDLDPSAAAARELREETGYIAAEMDYLGAIAPNPALQDNHCHTCVARGLTKVGRPQLDAKEDIELATYPLEQVPQLIADGKLSHSLVVVAFVWLLGLGSRAR